MKPPAQRLKGVDQKLEPKVKTRVSLRVREEKSSKSRAGNRVKPTSLSVSIPTQMKLLTAEFFQIDALDLAPRLLGKFLRRDNVVLRITEVEAYRPNDSACHGRFGITPRTAPMFGAGGHAYVYLCYGLHIMLNIVADKKGLGSAVLIRSCSPVTGLETIQERRSLKTDKPILLNGPGKVGQALGLTREWSDHCLYSPGNESLRFFEKSLKAIFCRCVVSKRLDVLVDIKGGLEVIDGGEEVKKVLIGPRVGIDYALPQDINALWRFAIADTPWISAPKNTLNLLL